MKKVLKKVLNRIGLEVHRTGKPARGASQNTFLSAYHGAVLALLANREKLHVVVVGANDGKYNDPIYDLIKARLADFTKITLLEPQKNIIPFLKRNYTFHPDVAIINAGIGPNNVLSLHVIREEFWVRMQPTYAAGWPIYRAPTGVTSTDRAAVTAWAASFLENDAELESAIESIHVRSSRLLPALQEAQRPVCVDVLQVDAEGFDDEVIYACGIEETRPALIYYESKSLESERQNALTDYLTNAGYMSFELQFDTLCIRRMRGL